MTHAEPRQDGTSGVARWSAYLDWMRDELAQTVLALDPDEQRRSRVPSGWSPIELLSHCLHMEQRWFVWGFLREEVDEPWGDWSAPDPWSTSGQARRDLRWAVPEGVTATSLAERLHQVGARTREVLATRRMDETPPPGGPLDDEEDGVPDLEWICFHVVTEYARHLGHLDIAVELGSPDN